MVTPGLLSTILTAKYQDHLPFYRQNMCNWQEGAYEQIEPLLLLLRQTVKEGIGYIRTLYEVEREQRKKDMRPSGFLNTRRLGRPSPLECKEITAAFSGL
jgi:transposase